MTPPAQSLNFFFFGGLYEIKSRYNTILPILRTEEESPEATLSDVLNDLIEGVSQNPHGLNQGAPYQLFYLLLGKNLPHPLGKKGGRWEVEKKKGRGGQERKLSCDALLMGPSLTPESFEAGMTLQSCPQVRPGDQAFVLPHQSAVGCWPLQGAGLALSSGSRKGPALWAAGS